MSYSAYEQENFAAHTAKSLGFGAQELLDPRDAGDLDSPDGVAIPGANDVFTDSTNLIDCSLSHYTTVCVKPVSGETSVVRFVGRANGDRQAGPTPLRHAEKIVVDGRGVQELVNTKALAELGVEIMPDADEHDATSDLVIRFITYTGNSGG